jgi:hypothetical protein
MAYIQSYKGQTWLLPPSMEDMIPEDHICFLVEGFPHHMGVDVIPPGTPSAGLLGRWPQQR